MRRKLSTLVLFAVISLGFTLPALAQEPTLIDVGSYSDDALSARLTAMRELYRIKLTDKEKELVSQRCEPAQDSLAKISSRLNTTKSSRISSYDAIIGSLSSLRALVVAKQVDPSNIELLIVEYQQKKNDFETAISAYQLALDDAMQVDCAARPEDFRAAVEGVRAARKQVVSVSAEIAEVTKSNLKTAFDTIKDRLQPVGESDGK